MTNSDTALFFSLLSFFTVILFILIWPKRKEVARIWKRFRRNIQKCMFPTTNDPEAEVPNDSEIPSSDSNNAYVITVDCGDIPAENTNPAGLEEIKSSPSTENQSSSAQQDKDCGDVPLDSTENPRSTNADEIKSSSSSSSFSSSSSSSEDEDDCGVVAVQLHSIDNNE